MYETHHRFLLPERKKRATAAGKIRNEDRCDLLLKGKEHSLTSTVNRIGFLSTCLFLLISELRQDRRFFCYTGCSAQFPLRSA